MIEHSGLARRALPKLVEPSAWLDSELTLTNLKRSLNRFRPNLAQGHLGPHLYPLSQMDDDVLIVNRAALSRYKHGRPHCG